MVSPSPWDNFSEHLYVKTVYLQAESKLTLHDYSQPLLNNQMCRCPSFVEFPSVIRSQWVSLRWYKFLLGQAYKCLHEEKLSRLPGLPYLPKWDNSYTRVVSPPGTTRSHSTTQGKVNSPRVTPGEGCLGYPRPYKWGLTVNFNIDLLWDWEIELLI